MNYSPLNVLLAFVSGIALGAALGVAATLIVVPPECEPALVGERRVPPIPVLVPARAVNLPDVPVD